MSFDTQKTQEILEKVISKPVLTDQLLSRPPFKFIVDIVSNVIKSTGYLKGDFSDDELKSAGNDKTTKTEFLEKLIKILDDGSGSLKDVKPAKIISGKDAEETNKMLQRLGLNASSNGKEKKKKSSSKKEKEKEKDGSKERSSSKKRSSKKESDTEKGKEKEKDKEKEKEKEKEEKKKKSSSSKERHKSSEKKEKKEKKEEVDKPSKKPKKEKEKNITRQDSISSHNDTSSTTLLNNEKDNPQDEGYDDQEILEPAVTANENSEGFQLKPVTPPLKTDDSGVENSPRMIKPEDRPPLIRPMTGAAGGRPMTSMGRPGTAASRPAPPKLKKKQIATVDATPQVVIELKSEIITDSAGDTIIEDDNFVMENEEEDGDRTARISELVDEEDRGALVQKIMETKAEIEDGAILDGDLSSETDKIMSIEKEKVRNLQEKLQDLTRSAYPLARLFDFANDDIESMIKELERWRSEQRQNEQEEQNKKAAGFGDSSRLYNIIANLQKEIHDMKEELSKARGRVLNNEKRIKMFISNV